MNKKIIYAIMSIMLLNFVSAASDPINMSLTEYTNFSRADNVLEIAQEMNVWLDGLIGVTLLLVFAFVTFSLSIHFDPDTSKAMLVMSFINLVVAMLFRLINFVPESVFYGSLALFVIALGYKILSK